MQNKKRLLIIISLLISFLIPTKVKADSNEYIINKYDIKIDVNDHNVFSITENIGAYFIVPKHGILRKIPYYNNVTRLDGTKTTTHAKISNVSVNSYYITYDENNYDMIKIGEPDTTLTGQKDYLLSYNYDLGNDKNKTYDELYFNIVGLEWDTTLSNISFSITLPKEFDSSKLGFSSGHNSSVDNDKITYNINGNTITGKYNGILNANEGLTVRLELPNNYFINTPKVYKYIYQFNIYNFIIFLIATYILIFCYNLWRKYGKDDKAINVVEFYPPEGKNSLEIGYLYKGVIDTKDCVSLLIYLANKGYLKIKELPQKFNAYQEFEITKLKEYDGKDSYEYYFFENLFKDRDVVTTKSLKNSFYKVISEMIRIHNKSTNIYEPSSLSKKKIAFLMGILIYSLFISKLCLDGFFPLKDLFYIVLCSLIFIGLYGLPIYFSHSEAVPYFFLGISGYIVINALVGVSVFIFLKLSCLDNLVTININYLTSYFLYLYLFIVFNLILFITFFMPKRNKYGKDILGKTLGFKSFLQYAEKDKLEAMVESNPSYYYDILPYAYVLNVSSIWISKFENIAMIPPSWFEGIGSFDNQSFGLFMNNTFESVSHAMTSTPGGSYGGGSSSSGGGSSGGGSGGGGGSSW